MNAPVSAALLQLRAGQIAAPLADGEPLRAVHVVKQPLVPATARLLSAAYEHDGLHVDLYGSLDESGYLVEHIAVWPSQHQQLKIDIGVTYRREVLLQMSAWCNRHMPSTDELLLLSQQEDRAERGMWMRNCAAISP